MKTFIQKCAGLSVVLFSAAFLVRSVQPAQAGGQQEALKMLGSPVRPQSRILVVNIDTINVKYKAFAELSEKAGNALDAKMKNYEQQGKDLQARYDALQQRVQMGTVSADQAQREEIAINNEMNKLKLVEDEINILQQEALERNDSINKDVTRFFKVFAARNNVDYILGTGAGSNVLYANDALDVTKEVLAELNAAYDRKKSKK